MRSDFNSMNGLDDGIKPPPGHLPSWFVALADEAEECGCADVYAAARDRWLDSSDETWTVQNQRIRACTVREAMTCLRSDQKTDSPYRVGDNVVWDICSRVAAILDSGEWPDDLIIAEAVAASTDAWSIVAKKAACTAARAGSCGPLWTIQSCKEAGGDIRKVFKEFLNS